MNNLYNIGMAVSAGAMLFGAAGAPILGFAGVMLAMALAIVATVRTPKSV